MKPGAWVVTLTAMVAFSFPAHAANPPDEVQSTETGPGARGGEPPLSPADQQKFQAVLDDLTRTLQAMVTAGASEQQIRDMLKADLSSGDPNLRRAAQMLLDQLDQLFNTLKPGASGGQGGGGETPPPLPPPAPPSGPGYVAQ